MTKGIKHFALWTVLALCLGIAFSGIALGQEEQDLNNYACKDVMRMTGSSRDVAIGVLHAFILGKKGTTKFETTQLADATDAFIEYCLDNPNDNALKVMEKMTKTR
ncbi:hypothetical protein JCM12296A_55840 [Desulfosarcina cetonica]